MNGLDQDSKIRTRIYDIYKSIFLWKCYVEKLNFQRGSILKINKDFKFYELVFYIIAVIFIIVTCLGLFEVFHFTNDIQNIFQAIFLISIGIGTIRKIKVAGVLFIFSGFLFVISAL
ncbi:hypothetical protein [Staphylococcus equorum]|uniref:hypothetical protein n=1 Tax=Staphylococcus equorum TaxID=246432 RepID=UPI002174F3C8|nr:hypothetical protein [Staphylococcus equorum]